jgi:MoxR-like ATPase
MSSSYPFVTGTAKQPPTRPLDIPVPDRARQTDPAGYLTDASLIAAVNVALLLGQPLLLTGEAGTGKTQLAYRLAWELGFGEPVVFNTKSTSTARDLFYTFDAMRRFHAAHTGQGSADNLDYLTFNALGLAILLSCDASKVSQYLPKSTPPGPRRCVVLIDEVDKAPRDFPNDLLYEVENMCFRVPELENRELRAAREYRPVVVLTSNSEKNLPDAFLRRCVFYHIPFPKPDVLVNIVKARLPALSDPPDGLLRSAVTLFSQMRDQNLRKQPATAELINWLQALTSHGAKADLPVKANAGALRASLPALAKTREDFDALESFLGLKTSP